MTARVQLVEEVIRPALAAGKTVISDRYLLANVVYQGHAGGLKPEHIWQVGEVATDGILPELTFVLDLNPEAAAARRVGDPDRVEGRGDEFLREVRDGFLREAELREDIVIIDASAAPEDVQNQIQSAASKRFALGE